MILLDSVATRYHLLPSEVLARADTLDLLVLDVAQAWHHQQQQKANSRESGQQPSAPSIPVNKLQEMLERVRR